MLEWVIIGGLFSFCVALLSIILRKNNYVSKELCDVRSDAIARQLERSEEILLRTEQRLIELEKKLAYINGGAGNELCDH